MNCFDTNGCDPDMLCLCDCLLILYVCVWFQSVAFRQDYGIAPMSTLLDIVKVMQFGVSMGKVAVHCHAGLGRLCLYVCVFVCVDVCASVCVCGI